MAAQTKALLSNLRDQGQFSQWKKSHDTVSKWITYLKELIIRVDDQRNRGESVFRLIGTRAKDVKWEMFKFQRCVSMCLTSMRGNGSGGGGVVVVEPTLTPLALAICGSLAGWI